MNLAIPGFFVFPTRTNFISWHRSTSRFLIFNSYSRFLAFSYKILPNDFCSSTFCEIDVRYAKLYALYHGTLFLGSSTKQITGLSLSQQFECKVAANDSPLEGSLSYWAATIDELLLENSLCFVHGRFVNRKTSDPGDPDVWS